MLEFLGILTLIYIVYRFGWGIVLFLLKAIVTLVLFILLLGYIGSLA